MLADEVPPAAAGALFAVLHGARSVREVGAMIGVSSTASAQWAIDLACEHGLLAKGTAERLDDSGEWLIEVRAQGALHSLVGVVIT